MLCDEKKGSEAFSAGDYDTAFLQLKHCEVNSASGLSLGQLAMLYLDFGYGEFDSELLRRKNFFELNTRSTIKGNEDALSTLIGMYELGEPSIFLYSQQKKARCLQELGASVTYTSEQVKNCISYTAQDPDAEFSCCSVGKNELHEEKITSDEIMLALLKGPLSWEVIEPFLTDTQVSVASSIHSFAENSVVRSEDDGSHYSYYISNGNSFPICLNIQSADVLENVSLLMLENEYFSEILRNEASQLVIDNLEGANIVKLSFQDGKLSSLLFRTTYID